MQASELIAQDNIRMAIISGPDYVDSGVWPHYAYRVRLTRTVNGKRRQITVPFMMGTGLQRDPDISEVLYCIAQDARTYESAPEYSEWCKELGYRAEDAESRKVYNACKKTFDRLFFFGRGNLAAYLDCEE